VRLNTIWLILTCGLFMNLFASSCNRISWSLCYFRLEIFCKIYLDLQSWHPGPCCKTYRSMQWQWLSAHLAFVLIRKSSLRIGLRVFWQISFWVKQMVCSSCMGSIGRADFGQTSSSHFRGCSRHCSTHSSGSYWATLWWISKLRIVHFFAFGFEQFFYFWMSQY